MNARLRMLPAAAIAIAIAAIMAGCGGDEGSTSPPDSAAAGSATAQSGDQSVTTSSLDKEEFVKRANAACAQIDGQTLSKVGIYLAKHRGEGLPESVLNAKLVKAVLLPAIEAEIAAIRRLGAPEGDEEEVEAVLAAQQAVVDEVRSLERIKSNEEFEGYFQDVVDEFQTYGFGSCAYGE